MERADVPPPPPSPEVYRPSRRFEEGGQRPPAPPTKWRNYNVGSFVCLAGVIFLFLSFLLPWYHIDYSSRVAPEYAGNETFMYDTNGSTVRIVELNGHDPVRLNVQPFTEDKGVGVTEDPMEGYLPIPMGIFWGTVLAISIALRFARDKPWARGRKFIKSGIIGVIFLVIIIVVFMRVHSALPGEPEDPGPFIFEKVGAAPFGGSYSGEIGGWEEVDAKVEWGVDIGYWLALLSAILFITGGTAEYILGMRLKRELEEALSRFGRMPFQDRVPEKGPEKKRGRFGRR